MNALAVAMLLQLLTALAVSALIGGILGKFKGRVWSGVLWGFLLGPIGWLLVFLGPDCRQPIHSPSPV